MITDREREEQWLAALTPEHRERVVKREAERLAAMTIPEQIGNHLGEALTLLHDIMGASTPYDEVTPVEMSARMAYHHVHMALKKMAKEKEKP